MAGALTSRGPGRPAADAAPAARQKLLEAARDLCVEVGLDAASTKTIAERAGVNPAMINYYFGGKEALIQAMMRETMAPVLDRLDAAARAGPGAITLEQFMQAYMRALAANEWLPQLVVREVLPANGRFRALFIDELASRAIRLIPGLLEAGRDAGRIDPELDLRLVMLSLISLAVFPFVAAPVVGPVLGIDPTDEDVVRRLVEHSTRVLFHGISPAARPAPAPPGGQESAARGKS